MKEVILRTPVIIGTEQFPLTMTSTVTKYRKGALLNERPPNNDQGPRTMAIRMPQQHITEYVRDHLQWLPLLADEDLVDRLEDLLLVRAEDKALKQTHTLKIIDLIGGPLFKTFSSITQERIIDKLEQLRKKRCYRGGRQEADLGRISLGDALFVNKPNASRAKLKM